MGFSLTRKPIVEITCLDGKSQSNILLGYPEEVQVLPGRHYLTAKPFVAVTSSRSGRPNYLQQAAAAAAPRVSMWLDAEAGRTYRVAIVPVRDTRMLAIIDQDTGAFVGGLTGGEPDPRPKGENCL